MAKKEMMPAENESDPENIRQRGYQGGANGIGPPPTEVPTYGQMKYEDGEGPYADLPLTQGTGSGLSGLPQADSGTAPALFNERNDAPKGTS